MNWDDLIKEEQEKDYFIDLLEFIDEEERKYTVFPKKEDRFNSFKLTPFDNVKAVIIGQDPYHDFNQAHGLAFSVLNDNYPPSLKNIFIELTNDLKCPLPKTGNLEKWAKEGVLLLNTALTVRAHEPLSHQGKGWEIFTRNMISHLAKEKRVIVFILWGVHANKYRELIYQKNHYVISSVHPSPLSARRGFFGSKPFSKTNQFLIENNIKPINWEL